MTELAVRPATPEELPLCSALLIESTRWAAGQGMPMWPEDSLSVAALTRSYHPDEFRLGWQGIQAVASMVMQREDRLFWPEAERGEALYLHKLAVSRRHAGQGLAQAMLRAAVEETRKLGRPFLRLDTGAERDRLRVLYKGFGFLLRGIKSLWGQEFVLYELRL